MALYQTDELEYMGDDYFDMVNFEEDGPLENPHQAKGEEDVDYEDDDVDLHKHKADTSALEARNGKDIQGIQWEHMNFSRDKYRETRVKQYKNYESLPHSTYELEKECKQVEKGSAFYDFQFNTRLVKSTIVHFQLLKNETFLSSLLAYVILKIP